MTSPSILDVIGAEVPTTLTQADLAVIPFGSIEYHGPHAPLGTDSLIAQELGARVAKRLKAVLYPLIAYTTCPVTTIPKPGTLSIDADVMTAYIEAIFRGLFQNGVQGIFALNAHDGNIHTIRRAAERIYFDFPDRFLLTINWWQTVPTSVVESLKLFTSQGGHGHGGPLETSAAWAAQARPGTVDITRAVDLDVSFGSDHGLSVLNSGEQKAEWPGYQGRISECSIEKGETLLKLAEDQIVELVQEWVNKRGAA